MPQDDPRIPELRAMRERARAGGVLPALVSGLA